MKSHYKHIKPGWTIPGLTLFTEDGNRSIRGAARKGWSAYVEPKR